MKTINVADLEHVTGGFTQGFNGPKGPYPQTPLSPGLLLNDSLFRGGGGMRRPPQLPPVVNHGGVPVLVDPHDGGPPFVIKG